MRHTEDETKDESKRNPMIAAERKDVQGGELRELSRLIEGRVTLEAPLAPLTTYHIGGRASALVEPQGVEDLAELLRCLSHAGMSYLILGGGSNVLFADEGYLGVVIRLGRGFQGVEIKGNRVRAKAGSKLVAVLSKAREANLGGVEFFAGIPGTLGGAVVGNAGAKKAWIGPFVEEVTLVSPRGQVKTLPAKDLVFGYRASPASSCATCGSSTPTRYMPSCRCSPLRTENPVTATSRTKRTIASGSMSRLIIVRDFFTSHRAIVRMSVSVPMYSVRG